MNARTLKIIGAVAAVAGLIAVSRVLPVGAWLQASLTWIDGLGAMGYIVFGALYVLATLLFIPGSVLTLSAGALFGVLWGTVVVSVSSVLGAAIAFLIGRFLARDAIAQRLDDYPKFKAVDRAIEGEGFKMVALTRLSPLFPFNLLNYGLGLTNVRFRDYVLASWGGMLPGTLLYVYVGSVARNLTEIFAGNASAGPERYVLLGIGFIATIAVTVVIAKRAKRELDAITEHEPESQPA